QYFDKNLGFRVTQEIGEQVWNPHPFSDARLEQRFFRLLVALGMHETRAPEFFPLKRLKMNGIDKFLFWDVSEAFRQLNWRPSIDYPQLIQEIDLAVRNGEKYLAGRWTSGPLQEWIRNLDFIEPTEHTRSEDDSETVEMEAFNLSPTLDLLHHG